MAGRARRPVLALAGSGPKGVEGVGKENADAKYDYNSCDGLEHNHFSGAIMLSNERTVCTVKGISRRC
jgi:hypothetical protein